MRDLKLNLFEKTARIAFLLTILNVPIASSMGGARTAGIMSTGSINYGAVEPPPDGVYYGFSNYPDPLTTAAVQDIIDLMVQHNLNVYRISCRPSYSEGSHPYRPELIRYFLDHAPQHMVIIVDANHLLYGSSYTQEAIALWDSHIKPRLLQVIQDFPNEPRVFVELFNELYVGESEFYSRAQDLVDYVEGLTLSYYPVLVVNKLHTSGLGWRTLNYSKNDIYQGYHGYFTASEIDLQNFTASMQNAVNMGIKIINTEMGADSGGDFSQSSVDELQQFYKNSKDMGIGNCAWLSWGTGWYENYLSYGFDFDY